MTKCGSPGSEADINTWHDTRDTALPCTWPLHPHVLHTHLPIPPSFLASSTHRYVGREEGTEAEREGNIQAERRCYMLLLATQN